MATYASDTGGGNDFDPVPEGSHPAICDMFVDFGLQESTGKYGTKVQHKVYLRWQIPEHRLEYEKDGAKIEGPMTIGKTFTLSLHEKAALRKILQSWRGKAFTAEELKKFDVTTVVGVPCLVSISHAPKDGGGIYTNLDGVMKLPNGMTPPSLEGDVVIYDVDNLGNRDKLRPWMLEKLNEQKTPHEADAKNDPDAWRANTEDLDDDIPF